MVSTLPDGSFTRRNSTIKRRAVLLGLVSILLSVSIVQAQDMTPPTPEAPTPFSVRSLVHLLDYIAQDYPGAVSKGAVVNELEYAEMREFSSSVKSLVGEIEPGQSFGHSELDALSRQANRLERAVLQKESPEMVAQIAGGIRRDLIQFSGITVAPVAWPDIAQGEQLFAQYCSSCHGQDGAGDGPSSAGLDPAPSNLRSGERIASLSPFQIYNTVRLGVDGTAMAAYPMLSDEEVWDVAFFVKSLKAASEVERRPQIARDDLQSLRSTATLERVATLGDTQLSDALDSLGVQKSHAVAALRLAGPGAASGSSLSIAVRLLDRAWELYRAGERDGARERAINAYLEGVEPAEPSLKATDPELTAELETRMMAVRGAIENNRSESEVLEAVEQAQAVLAIASDVLHDKQGSPWFAFLMSASILMREGLEAFLIILAILGVLRAVGEKRAMAWVHGGWILAVLLGVIGWYYSDLLIRFGAVRRELLEGGIALVAVCVLLYAGFWLHSKTEITKWKEFVDGRVKRLVGGGNLFGLAAISFFAVFREAFESVLFLSALTVEEGGGNTFAIAAGAVLAIGGVLVLAAVALKYSKRIPIRSLFRYSSFVMAVLSVVLVGKGIHAVQETGLISITTAPFSGRVALLGFYPTIETLAAQLIIVSIVTILWTWPRMRKAPA